MEMPAAQFRVRFFELLDEVAESGEEIVITKHGRPVARVVPEQKRPAERWGCMSGTIRVVGDIESPVLEPLCDEHDPA
jgi:prevent-host-death family protein